MDKIKEHYTIFEPAELAERRRDVQYIRSSWVIGPVEIGEPIQQGGDNGEGTAVV